MGNKTISDGQEHKINNLTTCRCNGGVTECRTPPGCMYDGKHYPLGPFSPSPCSHCDCTAPGEVHCAFEDCFFRCVDSIRKPNTCCPICPNGESDRNNSLNYQTYIEETSYPVRAVKTSYGRYQDLVSFQYLLWLTTCSYCPKC